MKIPHGNVFWWRFGVDESNRAKFDIAGGFLANMWGSIGVTFSWRFTYININLLIFYIDINWCNGVK